jgi:hypothetical protein
MEPKVSSKDATMKNLIAETKRLSK